MVVLYLKIEHLLFSFNLDYRPIFSQLSTTVFTPV